MRSYRIVLEYTVNTGTPITPDEWYWHDLLDIGPDEAVSVVSVEDIETPAGHLEEITNG